ncbi:MAG: chromate efflux transporter [Alphaproteobacteria bacterium]|jgi:chromate transporter|nr:chromate efflux transporter [Alphaproteobacteria bacterium]
MKPIAPYTGAPSLWDLIRYFLYLGSVGFGGPFALIGYIRRDLMEKRGWISHAEFLNGLALASLCPGPLATQLAIYIGWTHARIVGAAAVLIAFTLPAFLLILGIAIAYPHYGDVGWARSLLYGISPAVIAIVLRNAYQLSKMIVAGDAWLWALFAGNVGIAAATSIPIYWAILASGFLVWMIKAPPRFISASLFLPFGISIEALSSNHLSFKLFFYFAWAGTVVFGSGYAIIPFIHEGVIHTYHWITERQFIDAISIGMITPGPIVLAITFIGYLIAGIKGAFAATFGIFLPCFLCVIIFAPHFHRVAHHEGLKAFVQGITIAVSGVITGATLSLGRSAIIDVFTLLIFIATGVALIKFKKIREPVWLLLAGSVGILVKSIIG